MSRMIKRLLAMILTISMSLSMVSVCLASGKPGSQKIDVRVNRITDGYPNVYSAKVSLLSKGKVMAGDYVFEFSCRQLFSAIELVVHQITSSTDGYEWFESCMSDFGGSVAPFEIYCMKNGNKVDLSRNIQSTVTLPDDYEEPELYFLDTDGNAAVISLSKRDTSYSFTISKNGYYVFVDKADIGEEESPELRYAVTASAGKGGTITPEGSLSILAGSDLSFTIAADDGYEILDVKVDGESVGAVSSYTFINIQTNHTIQAEFQRVETNLGTVLEDLLDLIFSWWN